MKMKTSLLIRKILKKLQYLSKSKSNSHTYRVVEIIQEDHEEYKVRIQLINKSTTFLAKPEDLLAKDKVVNLFSQLDVRLLTYLGYLGINSPKYKILAKQLANDGKVIFKILKKGVKKPISKTAAELIRDNEVNKMTPLDAGEIAYEYAVDDFKKEYKQKNEARNLMTTE